MSSALFHPPRSAPSEVSWCLRDLKDVDDPVVPPHEIRLHACSVYAQSRLGHLYSTLATADHTYSTQRLCSRTPASTVLYRTGHSVMNYSFAVVLCVSESVKDIFRLHACLQDSSLFPHFLITTWPSITADYGYPS
ncbi:hypothetical protein J6590_078262 [Homalodisca vitripennis]|nr:hypothetical protein J6590_078262 [Homalodisca vitripennis]